MCVSSFEIYRKPLILSTLEHIALLYFTVHRSFNEIFIFLVQLFSDQQTRQRKHFITSKRLGSSSVHQLQKAFFVAVVDHLGWDLREDFEAKYS